MPRHRRNTRFRFIFDQNGENGVDPYAHLADVITRIVAGQSAKPARRPAALGLCPHALKAVA